MLSCCPAWWPGPLLDAQFGASEMQDMQASSETAPLFAGGHRRLQPQPTDGLSPVDLNSFAPDVSNRTHDGGQRDRRGQLRRGEKERKTLEALLYTPTTDFELVAAKLAAAWVPAIIVAWVGFCPLWNCGEWGCVGYHGGAIFFPNTMWAVLALWVAPGAAGAGP